MRAVALKFTYRWRWYFGPFPIIARVLLPMCLTIVTADKPASVCAKLCSELLLSRLQLESALGIQAFP